MKYDNFDLMVFMMFINEIIHTGKHTQLEFVREFRNTDAKRAFLYIYK